MPLLNQFAGQEVPDESGAAADEYLHPVFFYI